MNYKYLIGAFMLVATASPALAEGDIHRPYMNRWESAYDSHWENRGWRPQDWVEQGQTVQGVIDGFYTSGILTDQYFNDNMPVLEVGYPFLELSGRDQRRVASFVSYAFNTGKNGNDTMQIILKNNRKPIGIYTGGMLQLH